MTSLVQYILIIKESVHGWALGSIVAQGCHAAIKCFAQYQHDPDMIAYAAPENLESMRKVVLSCPMDNWTCIKEKADALGVQYSEWIEQPEGTLTCVAFKPASKDLIGSLFTGLKLLR